jgi:hypothetical protein
VQTLSFLYAPMQASVVISHFMHSSASSPIRSIGPIATRLFALGIVVLDLVELLRPDRLYFPKS